MRSARFAIHRVNAFLLAMTHLVSRQVGFGVRGHAAESEIRELCTVKQHLWILSLYSMSTPLIGSS